jgi:hypothetical protein
LKIRIVTLKLSLPSARLAQFCVGCGHNLESAMLMEAVAYPSCTGKEIDNGKSFCLHNFSPQLLFIIVR